jgi:hypothetical protein
MFTVAASAALPDGNGAQTFTQVDHNVVQSGPDHTPCTGDPGTLTTTLNDVFHLTINNTGSWFHGTLTGSVLFVPDDPGLPTYSGQVTNTFGNETNLQNGVFHFASNIEALGSDGSHVPFHGNGVVTLNANGVVTVSFQNFFRD